MPSEHKLYYYDAQGYLQSTHVGAAGATNEAPPTIPAGKVAQWNDTDWVAVNPPSAAAASLTTAQIEDLPQVIAYNGDSTVNTVTAGPDAGGNHYVQTYGWTGGLLTSVSTWVKQ